MCYSLFYTEPCHVYFPSFPCSVLIFLHRLVFDQFQPMERTLKENWKGKRGEARFFSPLFLLLAFVQDACLDVSRYLLKLLLLGPGSQTSGSCKNHPLFSIQLRIRKKVKYWFWTWWWCDTVMVYLCCYTRPQMPSDYLN